MVGRVGLLLMMNTIPYLSFRGKVGRYLLPSSHSPTRVRASGEPRIDSVV